MNQKFLHIAIPSVDSPLAFGQHMDGRLSSCLKKHKDSVILDLGKISNLDSSYVGVLTRWHRNLKSVGGSLVIVGVGPDKLPVLEQAQLDALCEIHPHLEAFQKKHPGAVVKPETEEKPAPGKTKAKAKKKKKAAAQAVSKEVGKPEAPEPKLSEFDLETDLEPDVLESVALEATRALNKKPSQKHAPKAVGVHAASETPTQEPVPREAIPEEWEEGDLDAYAVGTSVQHSGEYQCLSCGAADFFLNPYAFHPCTREDCEDPGTGWHLVFKLF